MTRVICAVVMALCVGVSSAAVARPISYTDAWTVIEKTNRQSTALWVHYTLHHRLSLGYRAHWDRRDDVLLNAGQATWLAKRWFGEDYQANLYVLGGAGVATDLSDRDRGTGPAGFAGVMADWETRRWFLSYQARWFEAGDIMSAGFQAARVGVAPYIGDFGDLHTWLMVEVDHRPQNDDPVGVTPLVRFFKGEALLELGWSVTDNQPLANFTYRF